MFITFGLAEHLIAVPFAFWTMVTLSSYVLFLSFSISFFFDRASSSIQNNITKILDALQSGYDKRVRPNYGGKWTSRLTGLFLAPLPRLR